MKCRVCKENLKTKLIDLGNQPLSNDYLMEFELQNEQNVYPLVVWICESCWLVQAEEHELKENIFNDDYAYFSSTSSSWLAHCSKFVDEVIKNLNLNSNSFVVEVASNDGYLLQYFNHKKIKNLGIEPTKSTAAAAISRGVQTLPEFFDLRIAKKIKSEFGEADLVICNNVLAHVPNLLDFVCGLKSLLSENGVISIEVPSLKNLIDDKQFDTIYHEHFSYFSLVSLKFLFEKNGLKIFNLENIQTHGGSFRIFVSHENSKYSETDALKNCLYAEHLAKIDSLEFYQNFQNSAEVIKNEFREFLHQAKKSKKVVAGYGAAAKGNTLLNFAEVTSDLIGFVCDAAPSKQGKYLPGSRIKIMPPNHLDEVRPDYVIIFPWNLASEIREQLAYLEKYGTKFVTFIPEIRLF